MPDKLQSRKKFTIPFTLKKFTIPFTYYTLKNNNFKKLGLNKYLLGLNKHHWGSINIYPHDHPTLAHTLIPFLPPRFLSF